MNETIARGATFHIPIAEAAGRLSGSSLRSIPLFAHGSLLVKYYAPLGTDAQTPHTRDEIYVVAQGRGAFFDGHSRRVIAPGDLLFAAAGITHRFEDFSDDFGVWVMFYGPENGEEDVAPTSPDVAER
jgi:mannose-6-phosphate isomerase-like protein (cupin superfamily)